MAQLEDSINNTERAYGKEVAECRGMCWDPEEPCEGLSVSACVHSGFFLVVYTGAGWSCT